MPRRLLPLLALLLLTSAMSGIGAEPAKPGAAWTHWRGPTGQGVVDDARVPLTWSEKENVLWKTKLPGRGHGTPVIAGGRVFLSAATDKGDERFVVGLDAADGKV